MVVLCRSELVHPRCQVASAAGTELLGQRCVVCGMGRQTFEQIVDSGSGIGRFGLFRQQRIETLSQPSIAFGHAAQQCRKLGFTIDICLFGQVLGAGDRRADVPDPGSQGVHRVGTGRLRHRRYSRALVNDALNAPAVLRGSLATLVIATPAVLIIRALGDTADGTDQSNWVYLAFVFVVLAYIAGGWMAARRSAEAPFVNGAAAPAAGFVIVQAIAWIASGGGISVVAAVFNLLLAATIGVVGAGLGGMRGTLVDGGGEPTG